MAYKKVLSGANMDVEKDLQATMRFLIEKFDATRIRNPYHNNLILLDKKIWWVVPSVNTTQVGISQGKNSIKSEVMEELNNLQSGVLLLRQLSDNRICIYLINDLDKLDKSCDNGLTLSWDKVESIKLFSEIGIIFGDELMGFKKLRKLRKNPGRKPSYQYLV
jgi:hypothetical protein